VFLSSETDVKTHTTAPKATRSRRFAWIYVAWALPVSLLALPLLPLAIHRANWRICNGALEITSPALSWFLRGPWFRALAGGSGFAAATIGHVIVARDAHCMSACRTHERVHVRQCARWGPLFPFVYIAAGLWVALKKRNWNAYYQDNPFEIEARAAEICATTTGARKNVN
jgi:hypothetical protein